MKVLRIPKERGSQKVALADKLRGGYYTPTPVAQWLCRWAIKSRSDRILEPSSGDGAFLLATAERLLELGAAKRKIADQITGVEILSEEAAKAADRLHSVIGETNGSIHTGDFFAWAEHSPRQYDTVVGNPPFIRYQSFPEDSRNLAMRLMSRVGLKSNRLTNIWVPFIIAATTKLTENGRIAFVVPAELLQVSYAAQLRSYLAKHFTRIEIIACNHLFFENAQQEIVLLLAEGFHADVTDTTSAISLVETQSVEKLLLHSPMKATRSRKTVDHGTEKWLKYFLSGKEIELMRSLKRDNAFAPLGHHATVDVGIVTGKNEFFVLSREEVRQFDLRKYTVPLVGRASHLKGAELTAEEWREMSAAGERVHLLYLNGHARGELSATIKEYIELGERAGCHAGYKCSIRNPWYEVPAMWVPEMFFFRQIYDFPRAVVNGSGATCTDTIHRMRCSGDTRVLASNLYTYLTAASAEIEGRSYGGGVLELEPNEAELVLTPKDLRESKPLAEIDCQVRAGRINDALAENSNRVLVKGLGLTQAECKMLAGIWNKMRERRKKRTRRKAGHSGSSSASATASASAASSGIASPALSAALF